MALGLGRIQRIHRLEGNAVTIGKFPERADLVREDGSANLSRVDAMTTGGNGQPANPRDELDEEIEESFSPAAPPEAPKSSLERVDAAIKHDAGNLHVRNREQARRRSARARPRVNRWIAVPREIPSRREGRAQDSHPPEWPRPAIPSPWLREWYSTYPRRETR